MDSQPVVIPALGLRCPIPALRLARTVREQGPGRYRLHSDDPAAAQDIPALCIERGWQLVVTGPDWFEVQVPR